MKKNLDHKRLERNKPKTYSTLKAWGIANKIKVDLGKKSIIIDDIKATHN